MKRTSQLLAFLALITVLFSTGGTANAALKAVGPTNPVTTIPTWYQDTRNLALQPCLDQNGFCFLPPPFDPLTPPVTTISTTGPISDANFPGEGFYYSADATLAIEGGELAKLAFVLEFAFLAGVSPDTGIVFLRTDLQKMSNLAPNRTYRVTHPYGQFDFATDGAGNTTGGGGVAVRQEDPSGGPALWLPALMKSAAFTNIGPFLTPADGVFPTAVVGGETHTYLGDAATPVAVSGSPNGNNFYRIDSLNADGTVAATWQTSLFVLAGRVFTGQIPSPLNLDRTTYARSAATGQIDLFVTATPAANLAVSGTSIPPTAMAQDFPNTGKFFASIPFSTTLPTGVTLTNNLDLPPVVYPVTLVDEVNITQASYDPTTRDLTVKAASRDQVAPLPALTVPLFAVPNTLDGTGLLVKTLTGIPPETVTVQSSKGGLATLPVSVVAPAPVPVPPVAVGDSASALVNATITIDLIANDSSATSTLDPASLQFSAATGGTVIGNANGTASYTAPAAPGVYTFAYTVADSATPPATSNTALVTVTVTGAHPVAANDSAATIVGTPVIIAVLANDSSAISTLNPASLLLTVPAGNGTAIANADGSVTYTPPALAGSYAFSYTVQDNAAPPLTSNSANVAVTVNPLPTPPSAANDTANAPFNTPVTVGVLANDTAGSSPINAGTVTLVSQPADGTAVANATGTVTYTPALNFSGSNSFAYTVNDGSGLTSNAATVTVTVAAAEAIAVTRVQFTLNGASWRVDGTVTPAPAAGTTLTIFNNPTVGTAPLIGTVPVAASGSFTWSSPKNAPQPNALRRISIQSNRNALTTLEGITVTVR